MVNLAQILKKGAPVELFHGSAYKQDELKPGFQHSGKLINWDKYESNAFLYATIHENDAKFLGVSSAWEKKFDLKDTYINHGSKTIGLLFFKNPPTFDALMDIQVYLYTLPFSSNWRETHNPFNGIVGEYRTSEMIKDILNCEQVNVRELLKDYSISCSS